MRNFVLLFALFMVPGFAYLALGSGPAQAGGPALRDIARAQLTEQGRQLFDEHCATCHGADAGGTAQGPSIVSRGPANYNFQMSTGRMPLAQPGTQPIRKPPELTPAQIAAVTEFLDSLAPGGVPIPAVDPAAGDLSQGENVFQLNCSPCHGAGGNGGAVGPQVAPNLHQATPTQIGEAVRIGPGTMPVFNHTVIDQQELNSLVAYVLYLRNPQHSGGASLGNGGPIAEGFIAIVVGLGALLVVTRFIGARS